MLKIGVFDSGMGGISVLNECYRRLDGVSYVFYADTDNVPYGDKSNSQIFKYTKNAFDFLLGQGVSAIVIACNTATSVAVARLRSMYYAREGLSIIGMEPAVKPAVETAKKRIMVTATPVTLREAKLKNLIDKVDSLHRVDMMPLPGLVKFAEKEQFEGDEVEAYLRECFEDTDVEKYSSVVLGCTHFVYFKPVFRKIFGSDIVLIDGAEGTVRHLGNLLNANSPDDVYGSGITLKRAEDYNKLPVYPETEYFMSGRFATDDEKAHIGRMHARIQKMIDDGSFFN